MARGINVCTFIGNLGADIELKSVNNTVVANVSLAVNEVWGTGDDRQQKVEWVPLVVWGRLAEVMEKYCQKGSKIHVSGRLQTRQWDDAEGTTRYKTEIVVREMLMLDSAGQGADSGQPSFQPDAQEDLPF
mgnify:CR=1 FL=1